MGMTGMIYMVTMVFSLTVLVLCSSTVGYDYFQFTQQYQPAVCNSSTTPCKDPADKLFTVHGLWPSNWNGSHPVNCTNKTMNSLTMGNLTAQLEIIWPNVLNRNDHAGFWNRQWNKHGTCGVPKINDSLQYFRTVIKMYITQKQNVSEILAKANIKPEGKNRTLVDILKAIRSGTNNKAPKLKCQKKSSMTELVEVSLCSDHNITQFINCPRPFPQGSPHFCPNNSIQY
ncbi:S34-RNase [Pyrus ussuriensis x Pyrus communis]|uniref:S34-RNase n=3 Tax=Pyrus TaxID=3766 RepID=A0A5N5GM02_9ROSA|nr:S34-RNase [Pyrus x bretschneideri]ABF50048.1 S34-RNase [Pyrus x bretschneideri]ABU92570.1 S17-RNase [Pyrus x bretschneideri]KAB2611824.1 S34-RNase [Pyrus ussuriensis x Pyrus communis]